MKTLILGRIPDEFTPEQYIPSGVHCFLGKENIYPNWENLDFPPESFKNNNELIESNNITMSYCNFLINELSHRLNRLNDLSFSQSTWRILLMPWLSSIIQLAWESQIRIKNLLIKYQHDSLKVSLLSEVVDWHFKDTNDYLDRAAFNSDFYGWILSRVLEANLPPQWSKEYIKPPSLVYNLNYGNVKWYKKLENYFTSKFRVLDVYGLNLLHRLFFSLYLLSLPGKKSFPNVSSYEKEFESLHDTSKCNWMFDINSVVESTLPDSFKTIKKTRKKFRKSGKIILVGPSLYCDDNTKIKLVNHLNNGEKIIGTQHGGGYGTIKLDSSLYVELSQFPFFSWGWTKQEKFSNNIIPLPSPYLAKFHYKYRNNVLLLVGTIMRVIQARYQSSPNPTAQLRYRKSKSIFLKSLKSDIINNTAYRPYSKNSNALLDEEYMIAQTPNLHIIKDNFLSQLQSCKILVLDHPGTTLNIAMAANIPTICFWEKESFHICTQAQPYFDYLEKAGILFYSPSDAANKVNKIWDHVLPWWNDEKTQIARNEWVSNYANTNKWWWWYWIKALSKL